MTYCVRDRCIILIRAYKIQWSNNWTQLSLTAARQQTDVILSALRGRQVTQGLNNLCFSFLMQLFQIALNEVCEYGGLLSHIIITTWWLARHAWCSPCPFVWRMTMWYALLKTHAAGTLVRHQWSGTEHGDLWRLLGSRYNKTAFLSTFISHFWQSPDVCLPCLSSFNWFVSLSFFY